MKIIVISSQVFPLPPSGYSGLEILAWLQAKGLAAKGHQVTLVAPDGSWCPNVQMLHTGPPGQVDEKTAYSKYWQSLLHHDCVIDNSWQKWAYALKAEGVLKAPVLGVCHAPIDTMYQSPPPVAKPCMVCISQDQADHFQALFSKEARVCYNGVDPDYYQPLNIPRSNRLLFLARFSSIKGPDLAIQACLEAGVGLDLVGDTSITNEPELYAKCKKLADGKQIRIIGNQNRGACVWWFSQAHALLHPNQRFREPFGLAPVEAMACGCPVIAWNYGAMRETIGAGCGWLVKEFKELVYWIKDIAASEIALTSNGTIRQRCRTNAQRFTVDRMIQRYHELCVEATDGGGW